jgi:hypothetical protein
VKYAKQTSPDDRSRALQILLEAQTYHSAMDRFRRDRERNKRYTYGDQWSDVICVDEAGKRMREDEYIRSQGNIPLTNNLIRRLVRNVIGVYRSQSSEPTCVARDREEQKLGETMSTLLQYNMQLNRMNDMYARTMEEFLISGFIVHRKYYGWNAHEGKMDCWTANVQPNNFFIDTHMRDPRGWDCRFVGEIHDLDFETVCGMFSHSPKDRQRLADIYSTAKDKGALAQVWEDFGYNNRGSSGLDFLVPTDETRCRVIEVWRMESKPRYICHDWNNADFFRCDMEDYPTMVVAENMKRLEQGLALGMDESDIPLIDAEYHNDEYWYYYMLSPQGDILDEGETPYAHKLHPYVFKAYPFLDGEIHSFVSDVIDQQRYVNRLVTLYDWIMRASAKGVLLVPEDCLGGISPEQFADTWTKFNGVLLYKPSSRHDKVPTQIANNSTNIGIQELLNLQLKFFEDISGVNGALQGKPGYSGMSAALYSQQTQNSTTSLLDLLESFNQFICDAAYKDVKNIQQYYDDKRIANIAGKSGVIKVGDDDQKIHDVEFDLSIVQSTATPAYRAITNDFLMEIWRSGQISLQQLLQTGEFPFADELLQNLKSQEEQLANGQVPQGLSPELKQQVQQGADMGAVNRLQTAMNG